MNDKSQFWSDTADKYSKKPVPSQENYDKKLKLTQQLFTPKMKVLEIGCGTGTTALIHAPFVSKIIATDFSKRMIEIATEKAKAQNITNVEFKQESVQDMNYSLEEFDVIMAHSILHLVEDKKEVMKKIHQFLRPGGHFVTSTGCIGGVFKIFKPLWYLGYKFGKLPYIGFFSKENFIKEIEECGFTIETKWDPTKLDIFIIGKKL